jgi:hypothetical protein
MPPVLGQSHLRLPRLSLRRVLLIFTLYPTKPRWCGYAHFFCFFPSCREVSLLPSAPRPCCKLATLTYLLTALLGRKSYFTDAIRTCSQILLSLQCHPRQWWCNRSSHHRKEGEVFWTIIYFVSEAASTRVTHFQLSSRINWPITLWMW